MHLFRQYLVGLYTEMKILHQKDSAFTFEARRRIGHTFSGIQFQLLLDSTDEGLTNLGFGRLAVCGR